MNLQPCVSSANVGQLTIDLIIATLKLPCVGQLESTSVLPSAGFDAFDHQPGQVALSLQLFAHLGQQPKPLYILQQRAPAAKGCQLQFAQDLAQWVSGAEFGEVKGCKACIMLPTDMIDLIWVYCQAGHVSAALAACSL